MDREDNKYSVSTIENFRNSNCQIRNPNAYNCDSACDSDSSCDCDGAGCDCDEW